MKWWEKEERPLGYVSFFINNTEVIIGRRLDRSGCNPDFFKSIDGFISITESYIEYPNFVNFRWFPWKEGIDIFPDYVLFAGLKTLQQWIFVDQLNRIYLHCDLGSHRAPSLFGAFLKAFFTDEEAKNIVNNFKRTNNDESRYFVNGELRNNPLEYIERKFEQVPSLKYLIEAIIKNPESDLSDIVQFKLNQYLPDSLLSKQELKERKSKKARLEFAQKVKSKLIKDGFDFVESDYSEFRAYKDDIEYKVYAIHSRYSTLPHGIINAELSQNKKVIVISNSKSLIQNQQYIGYTFSKFYNYYKYDLFLKESL
jgi:hypothetical protein